MSETAGHFVSRVKEAYPAAVRYGGMDWVYGGAVDVAELIADIEENGFRAGSAEGKWKALD